MRFLEAANYDWPKRVAIFDINTASRPMWRHADRELRVLPVPCSRLAAYVTELSCRHW